MKQQTHTHSTKDGGGSQQKERIFKASIPVDEKFSAQHWYESIKDVFETCQVQLTVALSCNVENKTWADR